MEKCLPIKYYLKILGTIFHSNISYQSFYLYRQIANFIKKTNTKVYTIKNLIISIGIYNTFVSYSYILSKYICYQI
jgi:hypothetical protein